MWWYVLLNEEEEHKEWERNEYDETENKIQTRTMYLMESDDKTKN